MVFKIECGEKKEAYLTVLFFDERFKFVEEGSTYLRVNSADNSNASLTLAGIKAPKNGYVYVYVSNESDEPVYFDNLQVAHNRGRIVEENHYYAFGLKIAGISSRKLPDVNEGEVKNQYLYNDKELFEEGDLNWYDYGFRNYDAQIGRFVQIDPLTWDYPDLTPYQYSGNDPIANVDLDGLEPKNVIKMLGSLSDQGINASSKLLEKGANAGKWLVSWIDKGGVAQLKMFASKSASALSTALNIGAKVADVGLDFVPIAGGARDIYRGVRDGNWVQAGIGALSIVADIFTFGGSSVAKGIIKNAVKEGIEATTKKGVKEVSETAGRQLLLTAGKIHKHHVLPQKFRKWFKDRGVSNIDDFTVEISQNTHLKGVHGKGLNPQLPGNWNKQWQDFIEANPKATPSEIFHHAEGLLKRFGLEHLPYKPYKN